MTEHLTKWKKNGWLNAKSKPVVNQNLLKALSDLTQQLDVEFQFVPGHKGIYGNERADELAKMGALVHAPSQQSK